MRVGALDDTRGGVLLMFVRFSGATNQGMSVTHAEEDEGGLIYTSDSSAHAPSPVNA
jgi:hypothetical protein